MEDDIYPFAIGFLSVGLVLTTYTLVEVIYFAKDNNGRKVKSKSTRSETQTWKKMTLLPPELRLMVWESALDNIKPHTLHIHVKGMATWNPPFWVPMTQLPSHTIPIDELFTEEDLPCSWSTTTLDNEHSPPDEDELPSLMGINYESRSEIARRLIPVRDLFPGRKLCFRANAPYLPTASAARQNVRQYFDPAKDILALPAPIVIKLLLDGKEFPQVQNFMIEIPQYSFRLNKLAPYEVDYNRQDSAIFAAHIKEALPNLKRLYVHNCRKFGGEDEFFSSSEWREWYIEHLLGVLHLRSHFRRLAHFHSGCLYTPPEVILVECYPGGDIYNLPFDEFVLEITKDVRGWWHAVP